MKDGYYLFIYSQIDQVYNILQLPCRHDQNMSVFLKNDTTVELICHLEFERFSGIKHHNIAFNNIEDCHYFLNKLLAPYNLTMDSFVGIYGTPGLMACNDDLSFSSIKDIEKISYHAISHLFSSLIMDTNMLYNEDILALAFDGGSDNVLDKDVDEKFLFCGAFSRKGVIEYFEISSPGAYWLYLSDYYGMPEGTLMALAYATTARSIEKFGPLSSYYKTSDRVKVLDEINIIIERIMSYSKEDEGKLLINWDDRFTDEECKISMVIKIIQELSIQNVFNTIDNIVEKHGINTKNTIIALSGGYALNCPTNTKIMNRYHFKEQKCVPCVNDGGLALGMGLYFFYKYMHSFTYKFKGAFYGYAEAVNIQSIVNKYSKYIADIEPESKKAALDIVQEPIIWIDGNAEIGPRALGHRSIIANPSKLEHKNLLNQYKKREWWRPVAPIILCEELNNWFSKAFDSPYMLNNFLIKKEKAEKVPAILHLDQSARVQSIKFIENPNLYNVIKDFQKITGIPIVCNTSLNDKGEPIINTIEQALNFALRKGIRVIYAYGTRICLKNHSLYNEDNFLKRDNDLFYKYRKDKTKILSEINPHKLPLFDLLLYFYNPTLQQFDIKNIQDVKKIHKVSEQIRKKSKNLKLFSYIEKCIENL
ncbi:MAG: carbamoyltransferase C-terminal domain-containing protein [Eisenbergiella massiliensis]|uniref:carbamoyltransferase C-terminal domain-containing protein n=1 Tax=Eisenbergiella massiliensis TaxID=1720294 RepID=UPI003996497A